tara:strand:- start:152 stop:448 length:297 start_codon:yes stop_codon:yes gene_type:complete
MKFFRDSNAENYEFEIKKHSVRVCGHLTSISLENFFWDKLNAIASQKCISINALVSEIDKLRGQNLSSAIRIYAYKNSHILSDQKFQDANFNLRKADK